GGAGAKFLARSLDPGKSMMLIEPLRSRPMYSWLAAADALIPGWGASGLGKGVKPLPLVTSNFLPSGLTRTEVGYHPVGMKPRDRLLPGLLTSNTATVLLSALAINSVCSSGDNVRLLGVDPGGASG